MQNDVYFADDVCSSDVYKYATHLIFTTIHLDRALYGPIYLDKLDSISNNITTIMQDIEVVWNDELFSFDYLKGQYRKVIGVINEVKRLHNMYFDSRNHNGMLMIWDMVDDGMVDGVLSSEVSDMMCKNNDIFANARKSALAIIEREAKVFP